MADERLAHAQSMIDTRALEYATEARQVARDARDECRGEYQALRTELSVHREETGRRFDRQEVDRRTMHAENQAKFDRLFRALYIATGILLTASVVLSRGGVMQLLSLLVR